MQKFFSVLIICFFTASAYAADAPTTALLQLLNSIRTIQANFTQTILDERSKPLQQSSGRMALQRPGKFRWDVTRPNSQLIVTDGKKLWIYDPDLQQVTIRSLTKEVGEAPALLLSNPDASLAQKFHVQTANDNRGLQWFLLTPKNKNSMFAIIRLGFAKQQLQQMQLRDHLNHTTVIQFNRITQNVALSPALFTFKIPAQVDVINEAGR